MHTQGDLSDWQEPFFLRQERVLLVGVDRLARFRHSFAVVGDAGQGEVYQVVIMVDPHIASKRKQTF